MAKPTDPTERGTIVKDPEFAALSRINKAIADLDEEARQRVMIYLQSRWKSEAPKDQ